MYNYWYIITFLKKRQKLFVSGGTQMVRTNTFNKEEFKKDIKDNCKLLYRKNIDECDDQQKFQAVAYSVKNIIIDKWLQPTRNMKSRMLKLSAICLWNF